MAGFPPAQTAGTARICLSSCPAPVAFNVPVGDQCGVQAAQLGPVQRRAGIWHGGGAPSDRTRLGHGQAELFGESAELAVVEAALAAGMAPYNRAPTRRSGRGGSAGAIGLSMSPDWSLWPAP